MTLTAMDILNDVPPVQFKELADGMTTAERGQLAEELQRIATSAAWTSTYFEQRYGSGCGDQGHASAVKAANKVLKGLRKVLGFTYPERGAINV